MFPDIEDGTLARMVAGIDVLVLRPDDELKRLAAQAIDLGIGDLVRSARSEADLQAALAGSEGGARWLADLEETKDPWFYFSCGTGTFYHHHRSWIDDPTLPIGAIGAYIGRLDAGEDIARPHAAILAERERITAEYRELVPEEQRAAFDQSLALAEDCLPLRREPRLLHRPPLPDDLLEQGSRVRRAARSNTASSTRQRTSSSCATTRSAPRSRISG